MGKGVIVAGFEGSVTETSGVHAQREQDFFADVVFPGFAGDGGDDLAGSDVHEIVICEVATETGRGLHESEAVDDVVASEGGVGPKQKITFAESHAAAMREEIANGHFVGDVRVVHLEPGEALIDGVVPGNFVVVDQRSQSSGGERFGVGANAEERIFVHGSGRSQLSDAVAFDEDGLAVFDDGYGQTGNVKRLKSASGIGIEVRRHGGLGRR